jgi:hypothetical protein
LFVDDSASVDAIVTAVNGKMTTREGEDFTKGEGLKALTLLEESNQIM